jgi:hypothetical protein
LKHTIPCHVKGGRPPNNAARLNEAFKSFEGKDVVVTVEKKKSKRSDAQNRYFHGVIIPVIQHGLIEAGWNEARSSEWTKDFIKLNCLIKQYTNEKTGEVKDCIGKTSGLTKSEFMDFVADVQQWAAESLGIYVPEPNEQTYLFND